MTRLIDADEFFETFPELAIEPYINAPTVEPQKIVTIPHELIKKLVLCVVDTVENIDWDKAIEAYKERPQGEWIEDIYHRKICNVCGGVRRDNRIDYIFFCNRCGADMRTKGEDQGGDV